jgi:CheY-like chemotaxis protein
MAKTLLLADDSVTIQKVVGISLASEDIRLVTVDNGDDALARARELRPDAILADCVMPGRSGYEVCEAIQADPRLRHIPVLLLTGTFEAFDEERALRCGAAGHIAKPFEAQTLIDEVRRLFALATSRRPAPGARAAAAEREPAARAARPAAPVRPAPAPPPPAPTAPAAPAAKPAPSAGESFDFFEDEIDDLLPTEIAEDASAGAEDAFEDSAIEIGGDLEESAAIEIGGDLEESAAIEIGGDLEGSATIGEADLTRLDATPSPKPASERTLVIGGPEELARPAPAGGDPSPLRVDAGDLAGATVLDPEGAGSFDVSAADLGDPFAVDALPEPRRPAARPTEWAPRPAEAPRSEPRAAATPAAQAPEAAAMPEGALELLEPEPEPPPQPEFPEDRALVLEETEEPARAPDTELAQLARSALDAVAPRLRTQLHDSLEKIAWESLSDVTDQIVRHAVERIEAIAWEVIPQMAETLIREEIRRMKGEDGSQG